MKTLKKSSKLLINDLVLYEGSEKVIQTIISEGDRNPFYRWKYWIPTFSGMTKELHRNDIRITR